MHKTSLLIVIALSVASSAFACAEDATSTSQGTGPQPSLAPPITPYANFFSQPNDINATAPLSAPAVLPPPLPRRPDIPEPDSNCVLPPSAGSGIPKPSFSHRAKAAQASSDNKQIPPPLTAQSSENTATISHIYLAPLADTLLALASACAMDKTIVESVDSSNGILMAKRDVTGGATLRLAISAKEVSPNHTTVTLSSNTAALLIGKEILEKAAVLISGGGSL